jgi:hypothetical protein
MPNWCSNIVTFEHADPAQLKKLVQGYNSGSMMSKFFPCPRALKNTVSGVLGRTPEQIKLEEKSARNLKKYGYANWYDWQTSEWGTKWDVGAPESYKEKVPKGATVVTLSFDSAWSPPVTFYEKMLELGFKIDAMYYESGVGFIGTWQDGNDQTYMMSDLYNSSASQAERMETMKKRLPAKLREAFELDHILFDMEEEEVEEVK